MAGPRYFIADRLGAPCRVCGVAMPKVLIEAGERIHACCEDSFDAAEARRTEEAWLVRNGY